MSVSSRFVTAGQQTEYGAIPTSVPERGHPGSRPKLPERFCNFDRLTWALERRRIGGGLVVSLRPNLYYMSGYASKASQSVHETSGWGALFLSSEDPEHPILVIPDAELEYVCRYPSWVRDFRVYPAVSLRSDVPVDAASFDTRVTGRVREMEWASKARDSYAVTFSEACQMAMRDLGIANGRVGFDDLRLAHDLATPAMEVVDAYDLLLYVRQVKTAEELEMLRLGAKINALAIEQLVRSWSQGMTWFDLNHQYHLNVVSLGGFVADPGGVIIANSGDASEIIDPVFQIDTGADDYELTPGMNVMLDCHGMVNLYRWDGGKTWVIESERVGSAAVIERASIEAMHAVQDALRPGVQLRELERIGLEVFERAGVPEPGRASVFFHGLGLSHSDVEVLSKAGRPDWRIEDGQIVSTHVVYTGDPSTRFYIEDNAIVHPAGGESLYAWEFGALLNS